MISVLIYEDNDKLRSLLELMIAATDGLAVLGAYPNGAQVIAQVTQHRPDVVVMDIDMPGLSGIDCVQLIKQTHPHSRVLMHTVFDDDDRLFNCLKQGADGYILKKDTSTHLIRAILEANDGGAPMSPGIARRVLDTFRQAPAPDRAVYGITEREQEILQLLAKGYTYRMLGIECNISVETVRRHLKNIYHKLHVRCGTEAVAKAMRERLI